MARSPRKLILRSGRRYRRRIGSVLQLARAVDLDELHWAATSAESKTLRCDPVLIDHLDSQKSGRITAAALKEAVKWLLAKLADATGVEQHSTVLRISRLNGEDEESRYIAQTCRTMLERLGKGEAPQIELKEVREFKSKEAGEGFGVAGWVSPQAAEAGLIRELLIDVVKIVGGTDHPGGEPGVDEKRLSEFFEKAKGYLDWRGGEKRVSLDPLGESTAVAYKALKSLEGKLDEYYLRCRIASMGPSYEERLERVSAEEELAGASPTELNAFMMRMPLAKARKDRILDFDGQINPGYVEQLKKLRDAVLVPLLGDKSRSLSEEKWREIKESFSRYGQWAGQFEGFEELGEERVRTYIECEDAVRNLINESASRLLTYDAIVLVEKLILYQAWLMRVANNFIGFYELFDPGSKTIFDVGNLIVDGRVFSLCVRVENRAEHSRIASKSNICVLYVRIMPPDGAAFEVAAPVTAGNRGNLYEGKRGIFHSEGGREYVAEVVQIIENPINLGEAIVSPFKNLAGMVTSKIQEIGISSEKRLDSVVKSGGLPDSVPQKQEGGRGNLLMAGSVAVAALGSATAFITKTLSELAWYAILGGLLGLLLAVMLPASFVALTKLRKRDIGAILEASGWAINTKMRMTMRLGRRFTRRR